MARVHTDVRRSLFFKWALGVLVFAPFMLPSSTVLAVPYGSGSYDACVYEDGCPASTPTSTTTTATTTATTTSSSTEEEGSAVVLNTFEEFFAASGKDVANLAVGDVVKFCIGKTTIFQVCDSTKESFHTVTLKSINLGAGTVVIVIASEPTDHTLLLKTPLKIDIDKDGTDDIELTLTGLSATTANINLRNLETSTPTIEETSVTGETADSSGSTKSTNLSWLWWSLGGVGILGLLAILIAIIMKKRGGGDGAAGYGSGPMGGGSSGSNPNDTSTSNFSAPITYTPENYIQPDDPAPTDYTH